MRGGPPVPETGACCTELRRVGKTMLRSKKDRGGIGRAVAVALVAAALLVPQTAGAQALTRRDIRCKYLVTRAILRNAAQVMKVRADCAEQQAIGTITRTVNCLEDPTSLGGAGTGTPNIDARLKKVADKALRRSIRVVTKCDTPTRKPQLLGLDTLCTPAEPTNWMAVMSCAASLGRSAANELSAYTYRLDPGVGTLPPDELECRSAIAKKLRRSFVGRVRTRMDCFERNDKGASYNCMATVAYPGRVEPTGFSRIDKKLLQQLITLRERVYKSCDIDLDAAQFTANPRIRDYTVSATFGGDRFTVEDLFQVLDDALISEATRVVDAIFPGQPHCGNGIREPGEQCDDGNRMSCDAGGCDRDCTIPLCGNGAACGPFETCDDGNFLEEDGCSSLCILEGCGDGILQRSLGEACDDGNLIDCDACDSNCTPSVLCNNGVACANQGEQCDLGIGVCIGGFDEFEGCISDADCAGVCTAGNVGRRCTSNTDCGPASEGVCTPSLGCGGKCSGGTNNRGSCLTNDDCPGACTAATGLGDVCSVNADCVPGLKCNASNTCVLPKLNDSCFIDADCGLGGTCVPSNGCIAGNSDTRPDTCRNNCMNPTCGDGAVDPHTNTNGLGGEECDDGNALDGDGCDSNCTATGCGNGIVTPPEVCDDGRGTCFGGLDDGATCVIDNECRGVCGSDFVTPCTQLTAMVDCGGAACINTGICVGGNSDTLPDHCRTDCSPARCGDGTLDTGEQCDDGNTVAGDGCDPLCQLE